MIKPEFWSSEQVVECSTTARLLFIGMWSFSDDAGIHPASIMRLKMEVFPADNFSREQLQGMMDQLISQGLVLEYEAEGAKYWQITGWKHQRIEKPTFKYPQPLPKIDECSATDRRGVVEESSKGSQPFCSEEKRKEDSGIPEKPLKKKAARQEKVSLQDLSVSHIESWLSGKRSKGLLTDVDEDNVLEVFKDYCASKGTVYVDYVAAYRNAFSWERFKGTRSQKPKKPDDGFRMLNTL